MLQKARDSVHALETKWNEDLEREKVAFAGRDPTPAAAKILAITRRALADLACADLDECAIHAFLEKLQTIDPAELGRRRSSAQCGGIPPGRSVEIEESLHQRFGDRVRLHVERTPNLAWGLELRSNGLQNRMEPGELHGIASRKICARRSSIRPDSHMADSSLKTVLDDTLDVVERVARDSALSPVLEEFGVVTYIGQGIARVEGLPNLQSEELVRFENDRLGMAFNLDPDDVGVILLDSPEGSGIRFGSAPDPSCTGYAGRRGDCSDAWSIRWRDRSITRDRCAPRCASPIETDAPPIMDRAPVSVPLATGTKAIDALIPVGRGQRQLILGDRQTGKTAIAIDCILNQKGKDVICIYCAIGQRNSSVANVIANLTLNGAMEYSIVVVAAGDAPAGLQFAAPYAAMTMGEYFMRQGRDALVVFDDLTSHANAYRELSLLLRRPPGRESFPGDIFLYTLPIAGAFDASCGRSWAEARSPRCRWCRPKNKTSPPIFRPI